MRARERLLRIAQLGELLLDPFQLGRSVRGNLDLVVACLERRFALVERG